MNTVSFPSASSSFAMSMVKVRRASLLPNVSVFVMAVKSTSGVAVPPAVMKSTVTPSAVPLERVMVTVAVVPVSVIK